MTLININNATYTQVRTRSIQLSSKLYGGRYIEPTSTEVEIMGLLTRLSEGNAKAYELRLAAGDLDSMLSGDRTLAGVAVDLESYRWAEMGISVQVEVEILGSTITLLLKTQWQDNTPSIDEI